MSRHLEKGGDPIGRAPQLRIIGGKNAAEDLAPISMETLSKDQRRLKPDGEAWGYLQRIGLDPEQMKERFGVGFAALSRSKSDEPRGQWLTAPVVNRDGVLLKRIVKLVVPEISVNPQDAESWSAGAPLTYWCGGGGGEKPWLFVAPRVRDAWRVWQTIRGTSLEARMTVIASTDYAIVPEEWKSPDFWGGRQRIYLGHDNDALGEQTASRIQARIPLDFLRIEVPRDIGRDWIAFFGNQPGPAGVAAFERRLEDAHVIGLKAPKVTPTVPLSDQDEGIYEDCRININGAFENGHMYYPFQVRKVEDIQHRKQKSDGTFDVFSEKATYYQTRVVRSDGAMLGVSTAPAPRGVEEEDRAIVLDDGTEILSIPKPRDFSTWTWPSIRKFVDDLRVGKTPHRRLSEIMSDVCDHLRQVTWLPNETDYDIIAAYIMMSYCYNAFDAIPMLLLNGEKGSGKSSLAEAIADLSFNGQMLGGGSEKAFVRAVDQGRGLLVLDDLEAVGRRGSDDGGYGDINQILKVSYSKATGLKSVVEKNGSTKMLNFYGPKIITNISGIDAVNATRMYLILCRPMPSGIADSGRIHGRDLNVSEPLRQELHAWGMANILDAHRRYQEKSSSRSGRAEQIAAPLRVIADMTGDEAFIEAVEAGLARLAYSKGEATSAEDLIVQAVEASIERGARSLISLAQIRAELALIPEARLLEPAHQVPQDLAPLQDHNALGRMLRTLGIRRPTDGPRVRLSGQLIRCYELDKAFVDDVLEKAAEEKRSVDPPYTARDPKRLGVAFCDTQPCQTCPYASICEAALPKIRDGKPAVRR
ncbi:hypothetical protein [Roseovarius sp.]|uniref:hypothetical protein n=1 Tax=Roseovarius sp. TaxID=1486281 RepID=UPI0035667701